jgi:hypothetical protein
MFLKLCGTLMTFWCRSYNHFIYSCNTDFAVGSFDKEEIFLFEENSWPEL